MSSPNTLFLLSTLYTLRLVNLVACAVFSQFWWSLLFLALALEVLVNIVDDLLLSAPDTLPFRHSKPEQQATGLWSEDWLEHEVLSTSSRETAAM